MSCKLKGTFDEKKFGKVADNTNGEVTETPSENASAGTAEEAPVVKKEEKKSKIKKTPSMNIFQRMLAVENALATVAKNLTVSTGNNKSYQAVSERDIIDAVKPLETEYGIYSYPYSREIVESHLLENTKTYQGNTTKSTTFMTRIKTIYRFVNVDDPDDYIETTVFSEGIDTQDKGSGKGMTYADKYALMKMYKISTGDDPDVDASDENVNYQKAGEKEKTAEAEAAATTTTKWNNGKKWK